METVGNATGQGRPAGARICIAILALGGEGGGVLAQWIGALALRCGYRSQSTSVPGVAQRTGATIYYVEMLPQALDSREPVLSLMPVPGDVDIVLASELMEAGRAMIRGFVTRDRTTLITSTHRVYAIAEKSARGDGRVSSNMVIEAANGRARRFLSFDMDAAARRAGCAISAVMFGALAGSGDLPFASHAFKEVIRESVRGATDVNLAGFEAGFMESQGWPAASMTQSPDMPRATTRAGRELMARIATEIPVPARHLTAEGVRRLMDYQDAEYGHLYLDRLKQICQVDTTGNEWQLTCETARYLALWMSYEDTIRVADLKVRASRMQRIRSELRIGPDRIVQVSEFVHPRFREFCDTLPRAIGHRFSRSGLADRCFGRFFARGRRVRTTGLAGFLLFALIASIRPWRRWTLRYVEEQTRIMEWLMLVHSVAINDRAAAIEIVRCQRVIKGYGETFERGLKTFQDLIGSYRAIADKPDAAEVLRALREKALAEH